MPTLPPAIALTLQAGYVAYLGRTDLNALAGALMDTIDVALPRTLEAVRNAAVELVACPPAARPGSVETLRQQLAAHLNYLEAFRAKYSRHGEDHEALAAAAKCWTERADMQ